MMNRVAKYSHKKKMFCQLCISGFMYQRNIFQFSSQCHLPSVTSLLFIPVLSITAVCWTLFSTQSEFSDHCLHVQDRVWMVRLINFHFSVSTACIFIHQLVSLISNCLQNVLSATGLEEFFIFEGGLPFRHIRYNSSAEFRSLFPVVLNLEETFAVITRRDSTLQDRGLNTGSPECFILDQI